MFRMLLISLTVGIAAQSYAQSEQLKVMVLEFQGEPKESAALLQSKLVSVMQKDQRFTTLDINDINKRIELESQRALFTKDCDVNSCLTEISEAYGARYIVHGRFGRLGSSTILSLQLYDAEKGKSVSRSDRSAKDAGEIFKALEEITDELVSQEFGVLVPLEQKRDESLSALSIVGIGVVSVSALAVAVTGVLTGVYESRIQDPQASVEAKEEALVIAPRVEIGLVASTVSLLVGVGILSAGFYE